VFTQIKLGGIEMDLTKALKDAQKIVDDKIKSLEDDIKEKKERHDKLVNNYEELHTKFCSYIEEKEKIPKGFIEFSEMNVGYHLMNHLNDCEDGEEILENLDNEYDQILIVDLIDLESNYENNFDMYLTLDDVQNYVKKFMKILK
jgi:hypothetical protein